MHQETSEDLNMKCQQALGRVFYPSCRQDIVPDSYQGSAVTQSCMLINNDAAHSVEDSYTIRAWTWLLSLEYRQRNTQTMSSIVHTV